MGKKNSFFEQLCMKAYSDTHQKPDHFKSYNKYKTNQVSRCCVYHMLNDKITL